MLGLLLRVVAVFLMIRYVLRLIASLVRPAPRAASSAAGPVTPARDLVRDRVCNTFVPRDRALLATIAGREEYFCSAACRSAGQSPPKAIG
jgi:hypothetical protein